MSARNLALAAYRGYTIVRLGADDGGYGAVEMSSWRGEGPPEWLCQGRDTIAEVREDIDRALDEGTTLAEAVT